MIHDGDKFVGGNTCYTIKRVRHEYFGLCCDLHEEETGFRLTKVSISTIESLVNQELYKLLPSTWIIHNIKKHNICLK